MKRFHVHMHVTDLPQNLRFYSALFGAAPARVEDDYAKWMLEDPPVNFAISTRGASTGIDHVGIQASNDTELAELKARAMQADASMIDEGDTTCCYANSNKHWVTDPQGLAWEQFHTLNGIPTFGKPLHQAQAIQISAAQAPELAQAPSCCAPRSTEGAVSKSACC